MTAKAGRSKATARRKIAIAATLFACATGAAGIAFSRIDAQAATPMCKGPLTGRTLLVQQPGFGLVQRQKPLPLSAGEYVLTIDDGPNRATTEANLKTLRRYCVTTTFMMIGSHADAAPDLARAVVAQGHSVGSHSYTHTDVYKMSEDQVESEISRGADAVRKATGITSPYFRIPSGAPVAPPDAWLAYLKAHDMVLAGYDISPQDWRNDAPTNSFHRMFDTFPDRGIIVMHDGQTNTVALLPMVLDELIRRHAKIVALRQNIGDGARPKA